MAAIHSCQSAWLSRSVRSKQPLYYPSADRLRLVRRQGQEARQRQPRNRFAIQVQFCSTDLVTGSTHPQVACSCRSWQACLTAILGPRDQQHTSRRLCEQALCRNMLALSSSLGMVCHVCVRLSLKKVQELSTVFRDVKHGATVIAGGDVLVWGK